MNNRNSIQVGLLLTFVPYSEDVYILIMVFAVGDLSKF